MTNTNTVVFEERNKFLGISPRVKSYNEKF